MNIRHEKFYSLTITNNVMVNMKNDVLELSTYQELYNEFIIINNKYDISLKNYMNDKNYTDYIKLELYTGIINRLYSYMKRKFKGLYLIYSPKMNLLKIGITNNIDRRLEQIKKDVNDYDLEVIEFIEDKSNQEQLLHKKFNKDNVRFIGSSGTEHREWFNNKKYIKNHFLKLV